MIKHVKNINKFCVVLLVISATLLLPRLTDAAVLYLSPESGNYHQNDVFIVEIRLDTQGEYINAVDVKLSYPQDILEFKDFSKGNSVLSLWVKAAENSSLPGLISFSGGIPGGYWGKDGLLGRLIFKVREDFEIVDVKHLQIEFQDGSKMLLNDGKGTEANLITRGGAFDILSGVGEGRNLWQEEIEKDKILPEAFEIVFSKDTNIFDGKYFIIFSTTDKQTGIDRYEVKEGGGKWKAVSSPYVLENQKLTSDISVKAIDKAGNFWMETLEAQNPKKIRWEVYAVLGLILIVIMIIVWIIRSRASRITSGGAQKKYG